MSEENGNSREQTGGRMVALLRPFAGRLMLIVVLLALLALTNMAIPLAVKLLIDEVFPIGSDGQKHWTLLWFILPALLFIYVVRNTLFYGSRMTSLRVSEDLCFNLRKRLFEHLQQMNLRYYKAHQAGKIGSRVLDDTYKIQSFIQDKLPTLLLNLLMGQVLLVIICVVNTRLAIATTIILPLHFITYRYFRKPIHHSHREAQENLSTAYGNLVEKFLGMEVVKGFSAEQRESDRFRRAIDASRQSQIRSQQYHFAQKVAADLLIGLGTVLLFGYGAYEVMYGRMTGGTFFMYFGYVTMLYPAVIEIISGFGHLARATASAERVFEMLSEPVGELVITGPSNGDDHSRVAGKIEFVDVSFEYEPGHPTLEHVSFAIGEGEHIAITGPSGSGKSTLMALLPRFLEPTSGIVSIDGRHLPSISLNTLRRSIGVVFQEVFLFNASIYENLRYARPQATDKEIIDACKLTGAHDFIERLPNGYQTKLGESGNELSRGEKQRITLARALIKNPQILILDEATASIDSHTARAVIRAIFDRMDGRTVVMVTHETDLLDLADRVVCISDGAVAFDGPPDGFTPIQMLNQPPSMTSDPSECASERQADAAGADTNEPLRDQTMPHPPTHDTGHTQPIAPSTSASNATPTSVKHHAKASSRHGIIGLTVTMIGLLFGCVSSSRTTNSILLEEPKVSAGLVDSDPSEGQLNSLAEALARWEIAGIEQRVAAIQEAQDAAAEPGDSGTTETTPTADQPTQSTPEAKPDPVSEVVNRSEAMVGAVLAPPIDPGRIPPDAGRLIPLPPLSAIEIAEIIDHVTLKFETEQAYHAATVDLMARLPAPPDGIAGIADRQKSSADGTTRTVLRLGYRMYASQPPHLWAWGVQISADGAIAANPDLEQVGPAVESIVASINQLRQGLRVGDLDMKHIKLSHVEQADSLTMLKALGVTTFPDPNAVPPNVNFDQLPLVIKVPAPADAAMSLIGGNVSGGQFGVSIAPTSASALPTSVSGNPANELLVLYHPAHPEQYSHVSTLITDWIDRPAQQVFIEGMVLEISEDGLNDLGIQWQFEEGSIKWTLSTLDAGGPFDTLFFSHLNRRNTPRDWMVDIRALIRDGKAEILSRPSVLTLDNRQAAIQVGEDIPIATSQEGMAVNTNRIKFDFKYLATGIMLNVRPRVSSDGSQVSMLIDTIVSATVPGRDLEVRSPDGELLATAPTVSARRVQTYARISNNTPFIIGGLVSKDRTVVQDKVPLLGDFPIIGMAFRSERTKTTKREVIIVLTPYVLPSDHNIARSLPKDEELFDSFGNELFRDAYRIRTEDVFDLKFLLENKRLMLYRDLAATVIRNNFQYATADPFSTFAEDRIPGEEMLVHRMIYEVVKRIGNDRKIKPDRMIYFVSRNDSGGYSVAFLDETLRRIGGGDEASDFFKNQRGKALAISYYPSGNGDEGVNLESDPVPEIALVDCPDTDAWGRLLWELNQPTAEGYARCTILLRTEKDFERLQRAIMLKKIIALNGGQPHVTLRNFKVGKLLIMPEIKEGQAHVIDADVARYFFQTEHYYAATLAQLKRCIRRLDAALRQPEITPYLDGKELPPPLPEESILE